jgi:serine phosphatase RsbU (regulator of sigma subunit)
MAEPLQTGTTIPADGGRVADPQAPGRARWWIASALIAAPGAGLVGAGVGLGEPLLVVFGVVALAGLALLQPFLDRRLAPTPQRAPGGVPRARKFLAKAVTARHSVDIAADVADQVRDLTGASRTLLAVPRPGARVWIVGPDGDEAPAGVDLAIAFRTLADRGVVVQRADLEGASNNDDEGARALAELLDRVRATAALPLRHRGLLVGALLTSGAGEDSEARRTLITYATLAVVSLSLKDDSREPHADVRALALGAAIDQALLPGKAGLVGGVVLSADRRPVPECGGDFWTCARASEGKVLIVVADPTGHGPGAATLAALVKGYLDATRHLLGAALDPAQLLASAGAAVHAETGGSHSVTALAVLVDETVGEITWASAGQPAPLLVNGGKLESLAAGGIPLGAVATATYQNHTRKLRAGDRLLLYTDGVIDAGAPIAEPYGLRRLRASLLANAAAPLVRLPGLLVRDVDSYLAGRQIADDLTVIAFEVAPP